VGLEERDKLQLRIGCRQRVSFSWAQAELIAQRIQNLDGLSVARREQYATLVLVAAAAGLRSSELLALRINDIDFEARTVRVDESSDQRTKGRIGLCKNTRAYRTVVLHDAEGRKAMGSLRQLVGSSLPDELIFRSRRGGPLLQTTVLNQGTLSRSTATRPAQGRLARVSTGMQQAMGAGQTKPGCYPATDGAHFRANDRTLQWRNTVGGRTIGVFRGLQKG